MQGNPKERGIVVAVDSGTTLRLDASGTLRLELSPGIYTLTVSHTGYLASRASEIQVISNETVELAELTLSAGDANGDGAVDIADAALVAGNFGRADSDKADLNEDGTVNILDLVLVNANFGKQGIQDW